MSQETWNLLQGVVRTVVAVAFLGAGVLHFLPGPQRTMAAIIPPRLRFRGPLNPVSLVVFTGLCEVFGGLGLLLPGTRLAAGVALAVFLVAVFPANAYAARHPERFGRLAIPFWPRLVAQLVMITLVLLSVI
ncbi:MAG: DoxX family protein [Cryobacterium sp.]